MENDYAVFERFSDPVQAKELQGVLSEHGIEAELTDNSPPLDSTFVGNTLQNQVELRIKQSDFIKAREVLEKDSEKLIGNVDKNYYLFSFSNEELYQILLKPDAWSPFDFVLAKRLLSDRGQDISPALLAALKKQRLEDLTEPESEQKPWIILGYISAFLGGFLGILIGWYLWNFKKTLPDGQKVYAYSEHDRKHGRTIFIIGIIVFPMVFLLEMIVDIIIPL